MALIKCPHCGHAVADISYKCPNCGAPLRRIGETDALGSWKREEGGLKGSRAAGGIRERKTNERSSGGDPKNGANIPRDEAEIRSRAEKAAETDGYAQGYGKSAGYEYGHDTSKDERMYGFDKDGNPYFDESYYRSAFDRDIQKEKSLREASEKIDNKYDPRQEPVVPAAPAAPRNSGNNKKKRPKLLLIILLILILAAASALAYYEMHGSNSSRPPAASTTSQDGSEVSPGSGAAEAPAGSAPSGSASEQSAASSGNNSDQIGTSPDGTDHGGTEDGGAVGGEVVDSGQ